jgi:hypothetical protein
MLLLIATLVLPVLAACAGGGGVFPPDSIHSIASPEDNRPN